MSIFQNYQPEDYSDVEIEKGEHLLKISEVEEKISSKGRDMLEIKLKNITGNQFWYYIVKNDYFNKNLTRFFDCFGIPYNSLNINTWVGKKGVVYLDYGEPRNDGRKYMEIKRLVVDKDKLPPKAPQQPAQQNERKDTFVDDIPF